MKLGPGLVYMHLKKTYFDVTFV